MKFLADESVDQQIVYRLRQDSHLIWYVVEMEPGISDDEVIKLANQQRAILLTCDKDFGELIFRQRRIVSGVILLRLAGLSQETKGAAVASVVKEHADKLRQAFTVITPGMVRIRHKSN